MDGLRILYFPWEGLSALLRALSLSGAAGNALAFFLYVCISLLPAAGLLLILRKERRGFSGADVWLLVLSAYTFYLLYAFINPVLLIRRLTLAVNRLLPEDKALRRAPGAVQLDLFTDYEELARQQQAAHEELLRERRRQEAVIRLRRQFGRNVILKGLNYADGATQRERNRQIGGHKA